MTAFHNATEASETKTIRYLSKQYYSHAISKIQEYKMCTNANNNNYNTTTLIKAIISINSYDPIRILILTYDIDIKYLT